MEVHRLGVKFFAADPASVHLENLIPVFHGWIQRQSVTGHLLIDVHDYRHLHHGPGILLVAHEGNFSLDASDGRPGLIYYRKTPTSLSQADHLVTILRSALQAARLLEKDAKVNLAIDQFAVFANDRLSTSNDDAGFAELKPALSAALGQVFEGADFKLTRTSQDPKDRLTITCTRL
jgi:hypothetical protein